MKKIILILSLSIAVTITSFAQSQNPPDINWKQINTSNFRIIFPQGLENYATQTASLIDSFYNLDTRNLVLPKPHKTDLLLYNRSVVSNAYATLAPKRMVWYVTPPQSPILALEPWNALLAIHEFRHITQFYEMKTGFSEYVSLFYGQYGWAGMINWAYPNWFFEGDAVYHETIFTNTGRGRLPSFSLPLRTIYLNNQKISYEKAIFRSYKTYYPNHYYIGYHLVSYINRHYGEDVWQKIIQRTNTFSYWPFAFERSVKKYTGDNIRKTYKKTVAELDSLWTDELMKNLDTTGYEKVVTTKKRVWTNYFDPYVIGKDSLLMLKSGLDNNTQLIIWTCGKEKYLREISGENISAARNTVVWTTFSTNPRFKEESFNDIVKYNLKTNKLKIITHKGKYFSPDISHNADKICAVKYDTDVIPQIVILDTNGNEQYHFNGKLNEHFVMPLWTSDDEKIIFIKIDENGESMLMLDPQTNKVETLIEPSYIKFDKPFIYKNFVLFSYDYTGITNIYTLNIDTKEIKRLTSVKFGASQAVVDSFDNKLIFTNYNLKGLDIVKANFNPSTATPLANLQKKSFEYFLSDKTKSTLTPVDLSFAEEAKYEIQDYKPSKHLLNFHSRGVYTSGQDLAFSLFSDDVLNTTSLNYNIFYNLFANTFNQSLGIDFKKYFPVFSYNIYGGGYGYYLNKDFPFYYSSDSLATWHKFGTSFKVSLPLDFSRTIYYNLFNASLSAGYENIFGVSDLAEKYFDFSYSQLLRFDTRIRYVHRRLRSYRDIYPQWGESITIGGTYVPNIFDVQGYRVFSEIKFYTPGFFKHHGIKITFGAQFNSSMGSGYLPMSVMINYPKGIPQIPSDKFYTASIYYAFPLCYPDLNIPYLLYIKRIRVTTYANYVYIPLIMPENLYSLGTEIVFDFNIFHLTGITLNAGVGAAYTPFNGQIYTYPVIMDMYF